MPQIIDLVWFVLIGLAAGWLAGQIMKGGASTLVGDLIVGVIGALVGGAILGVLGFHATNLVGRLITATIGALILIAGLRAIRRGSV